MKFLYIPLDYISVLTKKELFVDVFLPIVLGFGSIFVDNDTSTLISDQYKCISAVQPLLHVLLGFTLAALTLLLSNGKMESDTRNYLTKRKVRGRYVSVYRYIVIQFSYLIICVCMECLLFYLSSILPTAFNEYCASIVNAFSISFVIHIFVVTLRTISNLYLIVIREF